MSGYPSLSLATVPENLPEFNRVVLEICSEYPTDGTLDYWWPKPEDLDFVEYDGCTRDLTLDGTRVMRGEPKRRSFCCGLTLEVFLRALNRWREMHSGAASRLSPADWPRFQRLWFVEDFNGAGPNVALEAFGLGRTLTNWDDALPGDFCNYWRTEKDDGAIGGHSVVFLAWECGADGEIIGLRYFSTQRQTNGVAPRTEHFGSNGGLSRKFFYLGRVEMGM